MKRQNLLFLMVWLLAGCASAPVKAKLPYDAWRLGFLAPPYMEVWTEDAIVEDIRGQVFTLFDSGTAAISYGGDPTGRPVGRSRRVSARVVTSQAQICPGASTCAGRRSNT